MREHGVKVDRPSPRSRAHGRRGIPRQGLRSTSTFSSTMPATSRPARSTDIDSETWRKAWDVKVYGYIDLTRIIYPHMCARKSRRHRQHRRRRGADAEPSLHRRLHGQHRTQHVHAMPGRRKHAPWRPRRRRSIQGRPCPGRHLQHVMARAKRLLGDENRWPELHAKFPSGRAGTARQRSRRWSSSSPPIAPVSSAAQRSRSTAAIPFTGRKRENGCPFPSVRERCILPTKQTCPEGRPARRL